MHCKSFDEMRFSEGNLTIKEKKNALVLLD